MSDTLTVLTHSNRCLAKIWKADGSVKPSAKAKRFSYTEHEVSNIDELSQLLTSLESQSKSCLIRGCYVGDETAAKNDPEYQEGTVLRRLSTFEDQALHVFMVDVDAYESFKFDPLQDTVECINEYIERTLPKCFHGIRYHYQLSGSAGKPGSEEVLKVHIWFWLKTPYTSYALRKWVEQYDIGCDVSVLTPVQPHFTANPIFEDGVVDPVAQRSGFVKGKAGDEVDLIIAADVAQPMETRQQVKQNAALNDPIAVYLEENDFVKSLGQDGQLNIKCPFMDGHSQDSCETSTAYFPAYTGGYKGSAFKCMHQSCSGRTKDDFLEKLGLESNRVFNAQDHTGIAKCLIEDNFQIDKTSTIIRNIGCWYQYDTTHYRERQEEAIRADIRNYLDGSKKFDEKKGEISFYPSQTHINGTVDALVSQTLLENKSPPVWLNSNEEPTNFVSFKNGILHIPTRTLLPHSPYLFTLNSLPYDYVEEGLAVEWIKFANEIFDNDQESIETLQEIFGYCITPMTSQQKMFMLLGSKRSGKGTLARVLTRMLGKSNVCGANLNSLASNFGLQPLLGKLLAIFPDVRVSGQSDIKTIVGNLLSISGEDDITVDRKYKDQLNGKLNSRIMIISNELPQLVDANDALSSRFIYLSTRQSFYGKEDIGLTPKLLKELPQIFLWALDGRDRLLDRGYFVQPESSKYLLEENKRLGNPLYAFIEDMCELDGSYYIEKSQLYDAYCMWCRDNGYKYPKNNAVFSKDLKSTEGSIKSDRKTIPDRKGRVYVFSGIKLIQQYEMDETELGV